MIELRAVSKFFDDRAAVDSIDLLIPRESIFGLIGPNGAGKTSTLKMLATLAKPDLGQILVDGIDIESDVRRVRRRLGYMPDAFGSFRGLSCREYLEFFGRAYEIHGHELARRVSDVLELTDLDAIAEEPTTALSLGLRQRLCLAKTLIHDPDLLVLDEPASGLDPRARIEIRGLLETLASMGKTIVISSHILADLEEICTHIAIIEAGRIAWQGPISAGLPSRARTAREVLLEVAEGLAESALSLLKNLDFVISPRLEGAKIRLDVEGANTNEVLDALLRAGIEVVLFRQDRPSLERLFLETTRGIIS